MWVLENILGTPPPEPPPNVPALEDTKGESGKVLTLREQMTLHRASPTCAGCHKIMDPIGFALENFDADASWRSEAGRRRRRADRREGEAVRRAGRQRAGGLRNALLRYSPQFVRMFIEKMMTYALGRGLEYHGHADGPGDCARRRRRMTTGSRRLCSGSCRARSSRCE